jgi:hypothetical protein
MGQAIAETYARDPKFYGGTYCVLCGKHFNLIDWDSDGNLIRQFAWIENPGSGREDGTYVGE